MAAFALPMNVHAVGEQLIDAIMRSDFVFDRNISNVPFFPLGFLTFTAQDNFKIDQSTCTLSNCSFDYRNISQGLGLPVWVGQKNMLILGQTLELDELDNGNESVSIVSGGALAGWFYQPSPVWQVGGFAYLYSGLGKDDLAREAQGNMTGAVARHRHQPKLHSYWGVVRLAEFDEELLFPYVGFDWYLGREWSISAVMPWPTINYGPSEEQLFKIGALVSGETWVTDDNGQLFSNGFNKLDIGFSWEQRLDSLLWFELGVGFSGLSKITIKSDLDIEFEEELSSSPFVRMGFNIRPDA